MKTTQALCLTLLALSLGLASCKKEIPGPAGPQGPGGIGSADPRLFNKWEIISGSNAMKFLAFTNDNRVTQLYEDKTFSFKTTFENTVLITGNQVQMNYLTYNYSISNDTLKLTNTVGSILAKRNDNAPTIDSWVSLVQPLDSFQAPPIDDPREDIGCDGEYLYMVDGYNSDSIYKVSIAAKSLTATVPFRGYYSSVEYAEGYLWASNSNTLRKLNKTTGEEVQVSINMGDHDIPGLAYDGQYFWCNVRGYKSDTLIKYDPVSNTAISKIAFQDHAPFSGITYVNGYLYVCNNGFVYKCTTSPFKAIKTYKIGTIENNGYGGMSGIAYDGSSFWIKAEKGYEADGGIWLYKVHLD